MQIEEAISLMEENVAAVRACFFEDRSVFPLLAACALTVQGRSAEGLETAVLRAREMDMDGMQQSLLPAVAAALLLGADAEALENAYHELKTVFHASPHLVHAALSAPQAPPKRVKELFEECSALHPLATGYEDLPLFACYAMHGKSAADGESAIRLLRGAFPFRNATQSLGLLLALCEDVPAACARAAAIAAAMKRLHVFVGTGYCSCVLAPLASCRGDADTLALYVRNAECRLRKCSGFSPLLLSGKERRMYAGFLVCACEGAGNTAIAAALSAAGAAHIQDDLRGLFSGS